MEKWAPPASRSYDNFLVIFVMAAGLVLDPTISSVSVFADTDVARFLLNWSASLLSSRREDTLRGANVGRNVVR